MERMWEQLLGRLRTDCFVTAAELAKAVGVSERTVRTRLKELEAELKAHGARLNAKPRLGYCLAVVDEERFLSWRS